MRVVIIANPAASGYTDSLVTELVSLCEPLAGEVVVEHTAEPGHATKLALSTSDGFSVLLSVGGDGTASEVVHGLAGHVTPSPMFIVPAGGANSCYRSFWGDDVAWPDALRQALATPSAYLRHLDLARIAENGRLVLAGASTGFPPQAIHQAASLTQLTGRARYERALFDVATIYQAYPGRVTVDDQNVYSGQIMLTSVGGSRYRGGQFEVLPHSIVDDGLLDICVVTGQHHPADMLRLTRAGAHVTLSGVHYARGRRVVLERTDGEPLWFEYDGEVLLNLGHRFTLDVLPHAVPMLVGAAADLGRRNGIA